jgi:hypothetical protein
MSNGAHTGGDNANRVKQSRSNVDQHQGCCQGTIRQRPYLLEIRIGRTNRHDQAVRSDQSPQVVIIAQDGRSSVNIIRKANIFGRLDRLEEQLASTSAMAISINEAVDRINEQLPKVVELLDRLEWGVANNSDSIDELEADFQRMICIVNHNADAVDTLEEFVGFTTKEAAPPLAADPVEPLVDRPARQRRGSIHDQAIAYAQVQLASGLPVVERDVLGRAPGGSNLAAIRRAFESLGLARSSRARGAPWVMETPAPVQEVDPLRDAIEQYHFFSGSVRWRDLWRHLMSCGLVTIHDKAKVRSILADTGLVQERTGGTIFWVRPDQVIAQELRF